MDRDLQDSLECNLLHVLELPMLYHDDTDLAHDRQ